MCDGPEPRVASPDLSSVSHMLPASQDQHLNRDDVGQDSVAPLSHEQSDLKELLDSPCTSPSDTGGTISDPGTQACHSTQFSSTILSAQHTQALIHLSTENAALKDRLEKMEKVVKVLLGMTESINQHGINDTFDGHHPMNPTTSSATATTESLASISSSNTATPSPDPVLDSILSSNLVQPTTSINDHARHPAAMTIPWSLDRTPAGTLQRACFSFPATQTHLSTKGMAKEAREARERKERSLESNKVKFKVRQRLLKVLDWRAGCRSLDNHELIPVSLEIQKPIAV